MNPKSARTNMILSVALITTVIIGTGCGGGPKYGASGKRNKKCDCPHWNAVPKQEGREVWSMNNPSCNTGVLQRTTDHGARD